jgi:CHAT domain-containing protein
MEKFYRNLREMRVGDALSTTMCQMQEEELFKHVVQWGSFKVLGANVKVLLP